MSEFDEMLRAGVISPGSQPRIQSKRASSVDHPTATVSVLSEARTSGPLEVGRGSPPPVHTPPERPFLVILGGEDLAVARKAKDALSYEYQCHVTRPLTDFRQRYPRAAAVLVTADAPAFRDALHLALPVLVLATDGQAAAAAEVIGGRNIDVERLPLNQTSLLRAVRSLFPGGVENDARPAATPVRPEAPPPLPPFVVVLGAARLEVARQAKAALADGYQCCVTRPLTDFWQRYPRTQMVVLTADAPVFRDALELGVPVLVLATADQAAQVAPLVEGREGVAVVTDAANLAAAAAKFVAPGVHPGASPAVPRASGPRAARARVLIHSDDALLAERAGAALQSRCVVELGSDRTAISRGGPWDAVVLAGELDRVAMTKALARKIPLVLLTGPGDSELAHGIALIPSVTVLPIPELEAQLLEEVEQLVGVWSPDAT